MDKGEDSEAKDRLTDTSSVTASGEMTSIGMNDSVSNTFAVGEITQSARPTYDDLINLTLKQQEEITDLKTRVRDFITGFPFGLVAIVKRNQIIKAVNNVAADYFQYSSRELANRPVDIVFKDVDFLKIAGQSARLIATKKTGETFVVDVFVNPLDMQGEEILFVSVQDVNEQHKLEQLRRNLMAMVSHDLRAPLTSVRLALEIINEGTYGKISDRGRSVASHALSSIGYLTSLIANLLDAEKLDSGRFELVFVETTISSLISTAITAVHVPEKSTIKIETQLTDLNIKVDENRIVQVLVNLIANAIKYSPENGKVIVKAEVARGLKGDEVKFSIIDEGPGIPPQLQSSIFERYVQLNQPQGMKRKGFGLGLAICKSLVEKHNGRIWVESSEDKGSIFCFTIPLSPE